MAHTTTTALTTLAVFAVAGSAAAFPVSGTYEDTPGCDDHGMQFAYDELGNGPLFPADELIDATSTIFDSTVCPPTDNGTPNALVIMTNLTGQDWQNVFYVADPETSFTNVDGVAESALAPGVKTLAMRIDMVGLNRSLIAESMTPDGIFEAGETWEFAIQNYTNTLGLAPDRLDSLDFAGASGAVAGGANVSSGSIIVMDPIPAPGALALAGMSGLAIARRRRA
ncbi:MAG: PEP-CTERM sorting domain-containing protein [Planctomycetota bacterium]